VTLTLQKQSFGCSIRTNKNFKNVIDAIDSFSNS